MSTKRECPICGKMYEPKVSGRLRDTHDRVIYTDGFVRQVTFSIEGMHFSVSAPRATQKNLPQPHDPDN